MTPSPRPKPRMFQELPVEEDTVEVYDARGRVVRVPRAEWREKVLFPTLEDAKADLERLYGVIVAALTDGYAAEVLPYARHLADHDETPARGAALVGAVLLALNDLDEAEAVLEKSLARDGRDALVLANLARVHEARGDEARLGDLLWEALTLDPNHGFTFGWFVDRARQKGGPEGTRLACETIAALPGSWRARIVRAGYSLAHGRFDEAARYHDEALAMAPDPVPSDLLLQMSGDLGKAGRFSTIVARVRPLFRPELHDFFVGANLMKAYLGLERREDAEAVFDALCKEERPDWQERLEQWRAMLASVKPGVAQA